MGSCTLGTSCLLDTDTDVIDCYICLCFLRRNAVVEINLCKRSRYFAARGAGDYVTFFDSIASEGDADAVSEVLPHLIFWCRVYYYVSRFR